jgi:tRNA-dihydrouridine synthase C
MKHPAPAPQLLLAPMEGLLDFVLRDVLTRIGGWDRCVSEFIRITDQLLPERVFMRVMPELAWGSCTAAGVPVRAQLLGSDAACMADNAARLAAMGSAGAGGGRCWLRLTANAAGTYGAGGGRKYVCTG